MPLPKPSEMIKKLQGAAGGAGAGMGMGAPPAAPVAEEAVAQDYSESLERLTALPPDALAGMIVDVAGQYLEPDEFEAMVAEAEAAGAGAEEGMLEEELPTEEIPAEEEMPPV